MKNIILLFLLVLSAATSGHAQTSDKGGPPKLSELIGFWKKVDIPNVERLNKVDPWPQQFQWFAFLENGKTYSMMTDKDYDYSAKDLQEIFNVLPADKTPDYSLQGQFVFIDNKEIADYQEQWGVNLFAKDVNAYLKKGRLIMSLDDGNGKVIYYRLLEKIQ